jgi:hypothetical protein
MFMSKKLRRVMNKIWYFATWTTIDNFPFTSSKWFATQSEVLNFFEETIHRLEKENLIHKDCRYTHILKCPHLYFTVVEGRQLMVVPKRMSINYELVYSKE